MPEIAGTNSISVVCSHICQSAKETISEVMNIPKSARMLQMQIAKKNMVYPPTKKMVLIERTAMNRSKEMWTTQSDAPLEGCSKEKLSLYCVLELSFRSELVKLIHSCYNFLSYMFPSSFYLHRHFTLLVGLVMCKGWANPQGSRVRVRRVRVRVRIL